MFWVLFMVVIVEFSIKDTVSNLHVFAQQTQIVSFHCIWSDLDLDFL